LEKKKNGSLEAALMEGRVGGGEYFSYYFSSLHLINFVSTSFEEEGLVGVVRRFEIDQSDAGVSEY
jgi:hypothetical protein